MSTDLGLRGVSGGGAAAKMAFRPRRSSRRRPLSPRPLAAASSDARSQGLDRWPSTPLAATSSVRGLAAHHWQRQLCTAAVERATSCRSSSIFRSSAAGRRGEGFPSQKKALRLAAAAVRSVRKPRAAISVGRCCNVRMLGSSFLFDLSFSWRRMHISWKLSSSQIGLRRAREPYSVK